MKTRQKRISLARRRERGASSVEFALVAPLLVMLVLGLIEFGNYFRSLSQMQLAVSASVRTGTTQSRIDGYEDQIAQSLQASFSSKGSGATKIVVYKANPATGRPTGLADTASDFSLCTADCWIFTWSDATKSWTKAASPTWPAANQKACGPVADTDFLGVWVDAKYGGLTGLSAMAVKNIATRGVGRLEPVPLSTGQVCKP
jgi:Flp pilus assembly protein TadG